MANCIICGETARRACVAHKACVDKLMEENREIRQNCVTHEAHKKIVDGVKAERDRYKALAEQREAELDANGVLPF